MPGDQGAGRRGFAKRGAAGVGREEQGADYLLALPAKFLGFMVNCCTDQGIV